MKKAILVILYLSAFALHAYCQNNSENAVASQLKKYLVNRPAEKAYLHFDKPYYAAGDTIYFKAYVTLGEKHEPSKLSGVLHVDLINAKNKIDQSIKLQLQDGVAWGDFTLPDSLPAGNYRVRAYTQWMRNEGEDAFFYQTIPIASIANNKIPESIVRQPAQIPNNKADIQFFPEGGSLTTGIRSKVAFKAIGNNGLGIDVKGTITDNENKEIAAFTSERLGMGYFHLTPLGGKTYQAKLIFADGTQNTIDLPKPETKGIVLTINNDSIPKASVTIAVNKAYYIENRNKDYSLLIYSGGIATTVPCKLDSTVITMDILKRRLHTGIATVTLFSPIGEPLCERLLFVQNYDQLNLDVKSDKVAYGKREKVSIKLNALDRAGIPSAGHFSVSVSDESKVPVDENNENTILTSLLLTSDLKGYVEQPNYYFIDTSEAARKNLDLVMLTHGYRRFEWRKVLNSEYLPIAYSPEKGLEISGQVKNLFGKPVAKGTITLLPSKGGPLVSSIADDKGLFRFSNLVFYDTTRFVLSAVNAKGKNSTKLAWFGDKPEPFIIPDRQNDINIQDRAMTAYLDNTKKERNEWINYGRGKGIMLKEVKIRDVKLDDKYRTQSLAGAGHADQVMHADEIEKIGGMLTTSLNGRLRGVVFLGQPGSQIPVLTVGGMSGMGDNSIPGMLLIVDGSQMPIENINYFSSNDVETVELLKYASTAIYGMDGGGGVIIITTKQGGGRNIKDIASIGILPIAPVGFYKAREFYSPKYETPDLYARRLDLRSTIYWQPEIQTDKNGSASFDYYSADGTGTYKMVVEGIDGNGNLGRRVYRYKVKL
jgi:TonB-dependent SusC/RagA subfamily outer membrane receptor